MSHLVSKIMMMKPTFQTARLSHGILVKNRREQTGEKCRSECLRASLMLQGGESE